MTRSKVCIVLLLLLAVAAPLCRAAEVSPSADSESVANTRSDEDEAVAQSVDAAVAAAAVELSASGDVNSVADAGGAARSSAPGDGEESGNAKQTKGKKRKKKGKKKRKKRKKKGKKGKKVSEEQEVDEAGAMKAFDAGTAAYSRRKWRSAFKHFTKAVALNPKLIQAHINLGLLRMNQAGDNEGGAELFKRGIDLNPHDPAAPRAFNYLGVARKAQGRLAEAEEAYRAAIQRNWQLVAAHYNLGILLQEQGKEREAFEAFRSGLKADPSHADSLVALGKLYVEGGKAATGITWLRKALKHEPDHRDAQTALGRALEGKGMLKELLFNPGHDASKAPPKKSRWEEEDDEEDDEEDEAEVQARRGGRVTGSEDIEEVIVLSYMTEASHTPFDFGFCRMLASAAHNRLNVEVLGRDDFWKGNGGAKLAAVLERLRKADPRALVIYGDADMTVYLDSAETIVDKYLGFGQGNAWLFGADCNCYPYLLFDNSTCPRFPPSPTPYRFLHAGSWVARAGTVVEVLSDIEQHTAKYFAPASKTSPKLADIESDSQVLAAYMLSGLVPEMQVDYEGELLQPFTMPLWPDFEAMGNTSRAGVRRHTAPRELNKCNPFDDVKDDDAVDVIRNTRTGSEPSILHLSRATGKQVYNKMASHFWFNRRPPAKGLPLPGRSLPRHQNIHEYSFAWGEESTAFADIDLCREIFRA